MFPCYYSELHRIWEQNAKQAINKYNYWPLLLSKAKNKKFKIGINGKQLPTPDINGNWSKIELTATSLQRNTNGSESNTAAEDQTSKDRYGVLNVPMAVCFCCSKVKVRISPVEAIISISKTHKAILRNARPRYERMSDCFRRLDQAVQEKVMYHKNIVEVIFHEVSMGRSPSLLCIPKFRKTGETWVRESPILIFTTDSEFTKNVHTGSYSHQDSLSRTIEWIDGTFLGN